MKASTGQKASENLFYNIFSVSLKFAVHLKPKIGKETHSYLHIRLKMVNSRQIFIISTCGFCTRMTSREIGTGITCDSQYFEIYNSHYIEILCIYSQYLNILFFAGPVVIKLQKK